MCANWRLLIVCWHIFLAHFYVVDGYILYPWCCALWFAVLMMFDLCMGAAQTVTSMGSNLVPDCTSLQAAPCVVEPVMYDNGTISYDSYIVRSLSLSLPSHLTTILWQPLLLLPCVKWMLWQVSVVTVHNQCLVLKMVKSRIVPLQENFLRIGRGYPLKCVTFV